MTVIALTPYLTDEMPHGWAIKTPLDALVDTTSLHRTVPAICTGDSIEEALSTLFRDANIGEDGWAATYREQRNRSLSIGDVVRVLTDDTTTYWVVMPMGFEQVDVEHVTDLLTEESWYDAMQRKDREREEARRARSAR